MKYILSLLVLFSVAVSLSAQTVSNVRADFSCPSGVTVTYDVSAPVSGNATLYYSPDNGKTWLEAKTVTHTGTTIEWDNRADNVKFGQFKLKVEVPQKPNPECVEIAGVCWATCNVDAPGTFAQNPEDAGMFYQWNRNIGWSSTDPLVNSNGGTIWSSSTPTGTEWEKANDPCPSGYRVPTEIEQIALVNSGSTWTSDYNGTGIAGRIFGSGGNTVFLPAAGGRNVYGQFATAGIPGKDGYYWSSIPDGTSAFYINLFDYFAGVDNFYLRSLGFSIRCVSE